MSVNDRYVSDNNEGKTKLGGLGPCFTTISSRVLTGGLPENRNQPESTGINH